MPRLSRVRSLRCQCSGVTVDLRLLREGLFAVAGTLQHLRIDFPSLYRPATERALSSVAADMWPSLAVLTGLVSLSFGRVAGLSELDLAFLPSMRQLERLTLNSYVLHEASEVCTTEQVECLAQCKALTDLHCGLWITTTRLGALPAHGPRTELIQSRFALLLRRRKENGAVSLRRLWLGENALIDPGNWQTLSQCTALEEVDAYWSSLLTAADWLRLPLFSDLRTLRLSNDGCGLTRLSPVLVFPALLPCRALRSLSLCGVKLHTDNVTLLARIPALESFEAIDVHLESLAPLTTAPALAELEFALCTGIHGEAINIIEMIPPMPFVRKLTIRDPSSSDAESSPLIVALLLRVPRLTRESVQLWRC